MFLKEKLISIFAESENEITLGALTKASNVCFDKLVDNLPYGSVKDITLLRHIKRVDDTFQQVVACCKNDLGVENSKLLLSLFQVKNEVEHLDLEKCFEDDKIKVVRLENKQI